MKKSIKSIIYPSIIAIPLLIAGQIIIGNFAPSLTWIIKPSYAIFCATLAAVFYDALKEK